MRAAWFVAAVVGSSCTGNGSDAGVVAEDALAAIVLQPDDMPGFSVFDEGPQAIADTPPGDRADPQRFDRRNGWKARYRRADAAVIDGALVVESRADLFDSSDGAQREFDAYALELENQSGELGGGELGDVEDLGDEAVVVALGSDAPPDALVTHTVLWRDRNVTASVVANGFAGRFPAADAIELARAQQRRIEAADQE